MIIYNECSVGRHISNSKQSRDKEENNPVSNHST